MSFASSINTVLQNDASVNALVTDSAGNVNIYSYNLPDNFPLDRVAIVFTYKKDEGVHALQAKNVLEIYVLYVVILSQDTTDTETIGAAVRELLDDYTDASILDVTYEDDLNGQENETERYYKTLQYRIFYKN